MKYIPNEQIHKISSCCYELDRVIRIVSYVLLRYGLYVDYGIVKANLSYGPYGKPYLSNFPDIHFNISHCPEGCICAFSDMPVGVDIQDIRPFSQAVADHCCSDEELDVLNTSPEPASEFTRIWTMKESYLKMLGTGITHGLKSVNTVKIRDKIQTFKRKNCYVSIASAKEFQEDIRCLI